MDRTTIKDDTHPRFVWQEKTMERKSMREDKSKSSSVSVSAASSETNLSESTKQTNVYLEQHQLLPTGTSSMPHDSNVSTENLELPIPSTFDPSKTQSEITFTNQTSSPQVEDEKLVFPKQSEDSGLVKLTLVAPQTDSLCQTAQESPYDQIVMSSKSTPTPPGSGSPQLDQLLSDLEEMKLKFGPETLSPPVSESSDDSPEVDEMYEFEDLPPDDECPAEDSDTLRVSLSSIIQLAEDTNQTNVAITVPAHFQTSIQAEPEVVSVTPDLTKNSSLPSVSSSLGSGKDIPVSPTGSFSIQESPQRDCEVMELSLSSSSRKTLINLGEEDYTSDILQSQEEHTRSPNDSRDLTEKASTQSNQDQSTHLWEATSVEAIHDFSSQSPSELTPETVTSARHFSFDELIPYPSSGNLKTSSDEDRPRTSSQQSEESPTQVDYEGFASVKPNAELTSSTSDEEYSIPPGYAKTSFTNTSYTHMPPEYAEVVLSGADSPNFEYSDPEHYFDCKQGASDFSETDPDEPETRSRSSRCQPQDHLSHAREQEKVNRKVLLSSGSEDYEDAFFIHEPLYNVHEESEELSDEEFTLCEPPVCEVGAYDDTNKSLTREITAELGSMSESSDDEFLTTRIVRRRVVIQADEMPDLPTQSVTEEKYKDENGHIVVKKVTRKIIRKCVSADGAEHEEVSLDGAPQGSISTAEGVGYSKVVKRTVVKSEGDHTEVTFAECEGFSASRQKAAEGYKVSQVERTTVMEGERTMTHQGDPSLASDLPSAQEDFKQALGYISGFTRSELPRVVEREIVKEDGTVVRRAHMRKGRTLRRTVVKGAGQRKQVLLEQVDSATKGSKPRDLQQHLHQLFHHYYEEEKEDNDDDEEEKE